MATLTTPPADHLGDVDVRTFTVHDLPHFPQAVIYISTQIGDPRVEMFVDYAERLGLPRTTTSDAGDGTPAFDVRPAGRGWRAELTPRGRLRVRARGWSFADVALLTGPAHGWREALLAERRALVIAGGPIPFVAGRGDAGAVRELLEWAATHPTASGIVPAVEAPA